MTRAYTAWSPGSGVHPLGIERRAPCPDDVRYRFVIDMKTLKQGSD